MTCSETFGSYLRERRTRLDAAALGYTGKPRRTAGLRREEVAQRARISVTWYSWLEQGRGGAPSAQLLDRLSEALLLTEPERQHLFVLGLGRLADTRYQPPHGVTPRLQRVLDTLIPSPAMIRTTAWDVVAWNRAAILLHDYASLTPDQRNILRLLFLDPQERRSDTGWEDLARSIVGAFRADAARPGIAPMVQPLLGELQSRSPEFAALWRDNEVQDACHGIRRLTHPMVGELELEFSSFAVNGRSDLVMMVYTPTTGEAFAKIRAYVDR